MTAGPGLAGALLVGVTFAKALAFAQGLPLIAVNHLEGHIHAVLLHELEAEPQVLRLAALAQDDSFLVSAQGDNREERWSNSVAGAGRLRRAHAPLSGAAGAGKLELSAGGPDGGRCGRRGLRQGGQAVGLRLSRRAVD